MGFTLSPWKIAAYDSFDADREIIDGSGKVIATVTVWNGDDGNALLIARAPELLKKLRSARLMLYAWRGSRPKKYGLHPELEEIIIDIEKIIAKAEGR